MSTAETSLRLATLRSTVYELLEDEERTTRAAYVTRGILLFLIVLSVGAGILETVPEPHAAFGPLFDLIELGCIAVFTVEYIARVWACVEDRAARWTHPVLGRLRYMLTPIAVIDLLTILPFYLSFAEPINLLFFRLLRILRIVRFTPALVLMQLVVYNERRSLLSALLTFAVAVVLVAAVMHMAEADAQPERFASIPQAMYWAMITMTTVGYGDIVPITPLGKLVAAVTGLFGIATLAFPTAILGAGFIKEMQKQDFLARASIVARVPLFRHLPPAQLAEITSLLHLRALPARYTIIRRGEHPEAMYFIDEGQVVLRVGRRRTTLGPGSFFGQRSLLEGRAREATAVTLTSCQLLALLASDFHRLIAEDEKLRELIVADAQRRAAEHGLPKISGSTNEPEPADDRSRHTAADPAAYPAPSPAKNRSSASDVDSGCSSGRK